PRPPFRRGGRFLFLRLIAIFGFVTLLAVGWLTTVGFLASRLVGGDRAPHWGWVGVVLALVLPWLAFRSARRAFRGVALPLADLMTAADAVARGNLGVRVPVRGPGEFARLAQSFNHMTSELERADQQRRNLTADVAHELRTPLHIIQGHLEGILDGVYEPTEEHIRATLSETQSLARLVDDLRTLSLAEAGQLPLAHETVDISDLLADVATSFSGQAEAGGITLLVEGAGETRTITGDAGRLDQVLSNLVVNALRHTPPGGAVTLRAEATPAGVRLIVADDGEGIPAADLPYIFDRFWRGDPARTHTRGVGSGLGLAIARQLVQAHGGQIAVASQVGQGTTFTIELPAVNG
ncbi:MAG: HAMP domain-containing histidine kinase, partial [Anaerolineae bacterium]|nr:HAMP domain-containing histidine kinase [Anaerolineae bacterium]